MSDAPSNHCGECRLCCKVMSVVPIDKPAGVWCKHACSAGCGIYRERPEPCVDYECLWLQSQAKPQPLSPEIRPDRCGVILNPSNDLKKLTALIEPKAWPLRKDTPIGRLLRASSFKGRVLIKFRDRFFVYRDGALTEARD